MEPRLRPPRITQPRAEQHGDADVKGRKRQAFGNAQFPVLLVEDSKVECGERNHEGEERQPEPGGRPKPVSKQEFHRLSVLWRRQQPCGPCRAGTLVRDQAWRRIRGKGGAWSSPLVALWSSEAPCFCGERAELGRAWWWEGGWQIGGNTGGA